MRELRFTNVDLMLVFDFILLGLMFVNLCRPDNECFVMSQDILLNGQLYHLRGFAN